STPTRDGPCLARARCERPGWPPPPVPAAATTAPRQPGRTSVQLPRTTSVLLRLPCARSFGEPAASQGGGGYGYSDSANAEPAAAGRPPARNGPACPSPKYT